MVSSSLARVSLSLAKGLSPPRSTFSLAMGRWAERCRLDGRGERAGVVGHVKNGGSPPFERIKKNEQKTLSRNDICRLARGKWATGPRLVTLNLRYITLDLFFQAE